MSYSFAALHVGGRPKYLELDAISSTGTSFMSRNFVRSLSPLRRSQFFFKQYRFYRKHFNVYIKHNEIVAKLKILQSPFDQQELSRVKHNRPLAELKHLFALISLIKPDSTIGRKDGARFMEQRILKSHH